MKKTVGKFTGEVRGPYPVWCDVSYQGVKFTVRHDDLKDLIYLLERMKDAAWEYLPEEQRHEV